jgi:hypothetical protein
MGCRSAPDGWWQEFVGQSPPRTAKLAVVRRDGSPHVAPVWVDLDGDRPPFSFVTVSGSVSLSTDPDELLYWATRIGGRYMGADQAEAYGRRNAVEPEMVVRVHADHVVAKVDVAG